MTFRKWLDTLVSEKGLDTEQVLTVNGPSGANFIPLSIVLDAIKATSASEQAGIKNMLVRIDFRNGNVVDYFRHLAQAIAI
jgi:hypothetical protein